MQKRYLEHHGILGQKWGVKNGPPYPIGNGGTTHSISEKKAGWKKSLNSERNEHLYNRKFKKLAYVSLGLGLAASGYLIYKHLGRNYIDKTLKAGKYIQTLSVDPDRIKKGQQFYAAFTKADKASYTSFFGLTRNRGHFKNENAKYLIKQKVIDSMKIANNRSANKVFENLYNNDDNFRNDVNFLLGQKIKIKGHGKYVGKDFSKFRYFQFNKMLTLDPFSTNNGSGANGVLNDLEAKSLVSTKNKFYKALKSKGFSALEDVNDKPSNVFKYSIGDAPIIVFDKSKLIPEFIEKLKINDFKKATNYQVLKRTGETFIKGSAVISTPISIGIILSDDKKK